MSKALFDYDTIEGIANTIRSKIPQIGKMRVSDMKAIIGTLHGYQSKAQVLSSDPVSYPASTFALSDLAFISSATKPLFPNPTGVHIWTKSTGGNDASLYIQPIATESGKYVPAGITQELLYRNAKSQVSFFDTVSVVYGRTSLKWSVDALTALTDGTTEYAESDIIREWAYSEPIDLTLSIAKLEE